MQATRTIQRGRGPQRPVGSIIGRETIVRGQRVGINDGDAVFGNHGSRCLSRGTRAKLDLHRRCAGAAHLCQIRRQLFLVINHDRERLLVQAAVFAATVPNLGHQVENRFPALLIKSVLQNVVRLVATGTGIVENVFHQAMLRSVFRQGSDIFLARHLFDDILRGLQDEVLMQEGSGEINFHPPGVKSLRLGPDAVFSRRQSRKIKITRFVSEYARRDRMAYAFGGHRHAGHLLTGFGLHGTRQ